jgi:hypothetical protein
MNWRTVSAVSGGRTTDSAATCPRNAASTCRSAAIIVLQWGQPVAMKSSRTILPRY